MKLLYSFLILSVGLIGLLLFCPTENLASFSFLGNFHPLLLHLPIGALLLLFFLELIALFKKTSKFRLVYLPILWFVSLTSVVTLVAGFYLAAEGGYNTDLLQRHKNLAILTFITCLLLLWMQQKNEQKEKKQSSIFSMVLFVSVILLSVTGHYGGSLTHGSAYLTKNLPTTLKLILGEEVTYEKIAAEPSAKDSLLPETNFFKDSIQPILQQNCYKCHNESKQKGDFRLDNLDMDLVRGLDAKHWDDVLYEVSEENMPPEEKEPLSKADKDKLINWITRQLNQRKELQKQNTPTVKEVKMATISSSKIASKPANKKVVVFASKGEQYYRTEVVPLLNKYCYDCHGSKRQKGNTRLDVLNWDMVNGHDGEKWHAALDEINGGQMPPKKKKQPTAAERKIIVDWMTGSLQKAIEVKNVANNYSVRRLTKQQYTNSLQELLGISIDFGKVLPDDGKSKMGFSNNGEVLQASALHLEYFQDIARKALNKAIVNPAKKPKETHYKITFGKGKGKNHTSKMFGGYQSHPIKSNDFKIELLREDGSVLEPKNQAEQDSIERLKETIGIGMRGSMSERFDITENGLQLYSALPHKELPPKSWQGPSPNLKVLIRHDFPQNGKLVFKVTAAKGKQLELKEGIINLRDDTLYPNHGETIEISAKKFKKFKNMQLAANGLLMPVKLASNSSADTKFRITKDGFYQVQLVHPYSESANMPTYKINIGKFNKIEERLHLTERQANEKNITTPVSLAYLKEGEYTVKVGGKFFVGLEKLVITPLPENDKVIEDIKGAAKKNQLKYQSDQPSIRVFAGTRTDDGMDYQTYGTSKAFSATVGETATYTFTEYLENLPIPTIDPNDKTVISNILILGLWNDYLVKTKNETGPPLEIQTIEIIAPYNPEWPTMSHRTIFFEDASKATDINAYTFKVFKRFMEKAFRRKVSDNEINRYVNFWKDIKADFPVYEESVKEVLIAILCSPNFLYILDDKLPENLAKDNDYFLASKLSYFLWNSAPDKELLTKASSGALKNNLDAEVERMVASPKVWRMIQSFTYDWLRVDRLAHMDVNVRKYPDFTRFVKEDMEKETYHFIHYLLEEDKSIFNLIDSDFAMLNQNLAEFYKVDGVKGNEFRPVAVAADKNRGGLLSQGAFLTGHSDGVDAHPIKRAVWIKEKILGEHIPPPPPNVPELDPETPGFDKLTLKEKLDLHRNKESCISCHLKIDPYGVVFENYDAVGRFMTEHNGKKIDVQSTLPDGSEIMGVDGIKNYILNHKKEQFTKAFVEYMFAYALGRNISFTDTNEINRIVTNVKNSNFSMQSVVKEVVKSKSFREELN